MVRGAAEQAGSMEEFKQGSDEIENIIRTIDNIAFQTNILVLNTAVEATINRITLCFCPAGDCVLAGLPCQLVQLLQFLPQSAYGFRRNFSDLIAPAHAEKAPVPHVDGDEQRFPAVSDIPPPTIWLRLANASWHSRTGTVPIRKKIRRRPPLLYRSAWGFQWDHKSSSDNVSVARSSPCIARPHIRFDASLESMWTAEDRSGRPAAGSR